MIERMVNLHSDPVDAMRREQRRREAAQRYTAAPPAVDHRHELGREAERLAAAIIRAMGHIVQMTEHSAGYDLLVDGVLRVEVKAALYCEQPGRRGRYQANVHNRRADLVVFMARNSGGDAWFVMPAATAGRSITIRGWLGNYRGKYAKFRDRWALVGKTLAAVEGRAVQTNLFDTSAIPRPGHAAGVAAQRGGVE